MKEDDSSYLETRYKLSGKKGERKCRHLSYCNGLLENFSLAARLFSLGIRWGDKRLPPSPESSHEIAETENLLLVKISTLLLKVCISICIALSIIAQKVRQICLKSAFQFVSHFL